MKCKICKSHYEYADNFCCKECAQLLREIYKNANDFHVKYKGEYKGAGGYSLCSMCSCIGFIYLHLPSRRWKCYSCLTEGCP